MLEDAVNAEDVVDDAIELVNEVTVEGTDELTEVAMLLEELLGTRLEDARTTELLDNESSKLLSEVAKELLVMNEELVLLNTIEEVVLVEAKMAMLLVACEECCGLSEGTSLREALLDEDCACETSFDGVP